MILNNFFIQNPFFLSEYEKFILLFNSDAFLASNWFYSIRKILNTDYWDKSSSTRTFILKDKFNSFISLMFIKVLWNPYKQLLDWWWVMSENLYL